MRRSITPSALLITASLLASCTRAPAPPTAAAASAPAPTNRVDINATVRQNLGITFAKVESRNVARTLRVPGSFELLPTGRRQYTLAAPGRVEVLVREHQPIKVGMPLYRLESPRWRELQRELAAAHAEVRIAQADVVSIAPFMEAHEKHHAEIQAAVDLWTERVEKLTRLQADGAVPGEQVAQARAALAAARTDFSETLEKEAELIARRGKAEAALESAQARLNILFEDAALLTGRSAKALQETEDEKGEGAASAKSSLPRWQSISGIEVRAMTPGIVESLSIISGATAETNAVILTTVEPRQVRFRARALQSDLGRLADGQPVSVVAPRGGSLSDTAPVPGALTLVPVADAEHRTIDLIMVPPHDATLPTWVRPGVAAFLEVVVAGGGAGSTELAIPLSCIARDGTQSIIFRRDPADPDKAIRMEADLGLDDGRWIVINSGVAEGNEIVLDGVYQLMVATSGTITKGGHFHSDGTFHEGEDH